ncbi:hypothetical protein ROLI_002390 [Roseobacter fucihabitans]|uniref:Uncharacterized protein n=1 Tax=Roseobacter fucihabitans TaxID=1537242 RepID=A0ABZ2BM55_9RHOB|nr:hypothetical protein [Roseobacter litoralis]MBC6963490.1 hypothetical protein [Roseobacter litoralis]
MVCEKVTGASYDDAFLATLAIGAANRADFADWTPVQEAVWAKPDPIYKTHYALFRRPYEQTKNIARYLV